jgi:hypothetical protein
MGKRRQDADFRRFFDEFPCVKIPRLRATGVVKLDAPHAIIQFGDRQKLIRLAHTKFRQGGSWSYFLGQRLIAARLMLRTRAARERGLA